MQSKESEFPQYIEKALKVSKSSSKLNADLYEAHLSRLFHCQFSALLISPKLLRDYSCGQIDLAYVTNRFVHIVEIKSGMSQLSYKQMKRLKNSQELLAHLFKLTVKLRIINQLPN